MRTVFPGDGWYWALPRQNTTDMSGEQMPFGDETVGGKRAMQRAGGDAVGIRKIAAGDRAEDA